MNPQTQAFINGKAYVTQRLEERMDKLFTEISKLKKRVNHLEQ